MIKVSDYAEFVIQIKKNLDNLRFIRNRDRIVGVFSNLVFLDTRATLHHSDDSVVNLRGEKGKETQGKDW